MILILTGPPAAGKNTVAGIMAKNLNRCAVIDVDMVRWMVLQPHKAPWEGEEGKAQQHLGVRNSCALARNFTTGGFNVTILDVLQDDTARLYKKELNGFETKIVLLLPEYDEIKHRNDNRSKRITDDEMEMVYGWQKQLTTYEIKINNTNLSADEVATQLLDFFKGT